jgi:hypothetical protein
MGLEKESFSVLCGEVDGATKLRSFAALSLNVIALSIVTIDRR